MASFGIRAVSLGLIVSVLGGCASLGWFETPEERVSKRAQQRLDALISGNLKEAFTFVSPAYRATTTWQRYGSRFTGAANWTEARVDEVKCEPQRCEVRVYVTYRMARPRVENTRALDEVWIELDGQWYIYPN